MFFDRGNVEIKALQLKIYRKVPELLWAQTELPGQFSPWEVLLHRVNRGLTQLLHSRFSPGEKQFSISLNEYIRKIRVNLCHLQKPKITLHKSCGMALWMGCMSLKTRLIEAP
ncbi:MAG TPA: hypothetical protein VK699_05895 [Terriglobales bacterium]|jgi:hypothetical protein|nr:hypothetical protein [Terriglobales bacterium]